MLHVAAQYFLNHVLEEQELRAQMRQFAEAGYECVYAHARHGLRTPYFSRAWWDAMRVMLEECRKHGLKFGIWDEDYFPSPVAGNRIIWSRPELRAQRLEFTVLEAAAGQHVLQVFPMEGMVVGCYAVARGEITDITAHCGTMVAEMTKRYIQNSAYSPVAKLPLPHWRCGRTPHRFALSWTAPADCTVVAVQIVRDGDRHNCDILNPETIRLFLELTHEQYFRECDPTDIVSTFLDEPAPNGNFPWTGRFAEEFQTDHSYDLMPLLAHLAVEVDARTRLIRHHYRQTQHRLLCQNYLAQVRKWCADHHLQSIGHLTRTEWLSLSLTRWPNELRCCRYLDIPCCDPLGGGVAWPEAAAYHTGIKVVSSAAHLFGKEQAGSDALAVLGNEVCLRDLKFHLDYQMTLGITYFNIHGLFYSLDGPRKDEAPPSLFYQHSEWPLMRRLLDHVRQTCASLARGRHLCQIAVLYPAIAFEYQDSPEAHERERRFHQRIEDLLSHQQDFDFIDDATLAEQFAADQDGFRRRYPVFLLLEPDFVEEATAVALEQYAAAGGEVIVVGEPPRILAAPPRSWHQAGAWRRDDWLSRLPAAPTQQQLGPEVFVQRREIDGEEVAFLFNRSETPSVGMYAGQPVWLAPRSGSLLKAGESLPEPLAGLKPVQAPDNDWSVRFEDNHVPLAIWEKGGQQCDLSRREVGGVTARFLFTGTPIRLLLALDESTFEDDWRCLLNGVEITGFKRETRYDCRVLVAEVTGAVCGGAMPTQNVLSFDGQTPMEIPRLYGDFKVEYRHGPASLPYLTAVAQPMALRKLSDWRTLGYPTFSGAAVYRREICVAEDGDYALDLGRVEDAAVVTVDDGAPTVLAWPPYVARLGRLAAGRHLLQVAVYNGPGNRDRQAGLPAGWMGPTALLQA